MKIGKFTTITPTWGSFRLTEHKYFEYQFEFSRFNNDPFEFSLNWTTRRDHAGLEFVFSVYKLFWICFNIHDNRHWDYKNDCWQEPDTCTVDENSWHTPDEPDSK